MLAEKGNKDFNFMNFTRKDCVVLNLFFDDQINDQQVKQSLTLYDRFLRFSLDKYH